MSLAVAFGATLGAMGLLLRGWAIRTLGTFFTSTVQVTSGQSVIDSGPYRLLRHPSYTGTLVHSIGIAIAMASGVSLMTTLLVSVPAYLYRIAVEEHALLAELGESYHMYRLKTWKLVPLLY